MAVIAPKKVNYDLSKTIRERLIIVEKKLDDISRFMDIENYYDELKKIKDNFNNKKMSLSDCDSELDTLNKRVDFEVDPFYQMAILTKEINSKLNEKEQGIDEAISNCYKLNDLINLVNTRKMDDMRDVLEVKEFNRIYNESIETMYQVLIKEQIYGRDTLLKEYDVNGKFMLVSFKLFKLFNEKLKKINVNNMNIDITEKGVPITKESIDAVIDAKYGTEESEYLERKAKAKEDLKKRIFDYQEEKKELEDNGKTLKSTIRNIKFHRGLNRASLISYVLVPILAIGGGLGIGRALSNNIDEYRTITRTVNPNTQEVVETISDIYDERENTYTATVKVYGPWEKKGSVYTRSVYAYNYDSNIDYNNVDNSQTKYHYTEAKETLSSTDSTEEATVLITETIQDKNDTRKSSKYVIPLAIVAGVLAIGAEIIRGVKVGTYDIETELRSLKKRLEEKKMVRKEYDEERIELNNTGSIIRKDCETASSIYQFSEDDFSSVKVIKKTW